MQISLCYYFSFFIVNMYITMRNIFVLYAYNRRMYEYMVAFYGYLLYIFLTISDGFIGLYR